MKLKHSIVAAAAAAATLPAGLLAAGAGASLARSAIAPAAGAAKAPTVALRKTRLGNVLVAGSSGRTLYLFANDGRNHSNCTGTCASIWPPLSASGSLSAGKGVSASKLGEIKRGHGRQVTYAGHPLYFFQGDAGPGQTSGEGNNSFYVVAASGKAIK